MRSLPEIVEDAYALFATYTVGRTLDVCPCCVSDEAQQELLAVPLRQVPSDLLWRSYYESARNYSEQELWEMKHFLPRVLELVSAFEYPCHSSEIVFLRLDLDQPARWLPAEQELLAEFALAFFGQCLQHYPLPGGDALADVLIMFGLAHFNLAPLLQAWVAADTAFSLTHFAQLLLEGLHYPPHKPLALQSPFSKPYVDAQLAAWLADPAVRATWAAQLEAAIMQGQLSDEWATCFSLAYEVVTRGLS